MLRLSRLHLGWKWPPVVPALRGRAQPVLADGAWRQPSSKQPLYLAGASSPCHMGPPGAIRMRGDRPEDASVSPNPGIPGALPSLPLCLHLSPRCGAGRGRASSGGCLFPWVCQTRSTNSGSIRMSAQKFSIFASTNVPKGRLRCCGGFLVYRITES